MPTSRDRDSILVPVAQILKEQRSNIDASMAEQENRFHSLLETAAVRADKAMAAVEAMNERLQLITELGSERTKNALTKYKTEITTEFAERQKSIEHVFGDLRAQHEDNIEDTKKAYSALVDTTEEHVKKAAALGLAETDLVKELADRLDEVKASVDEKHATLAQVVEASGNAAVASVKEVASSVLHEVEDRLAALSKAEDGLSGDVEEVRTRVEAVEKRGADMFEIVRHNKDALTDEVASLDKVIVGVSDEVKGVRLEATEADAAARADTTKALDALRADLERNIDTVKAAAAEDLKAEVAELTEFANAIDDGGKLFHKTNKAEHTELTEKIEKNRLHANQLSADIKSLDEKTQESVALAVVQSNENRDDLEKKITESVGAVKAGLQAGIAGQVKQLVAVDESLKTEIKDLRDATSAWTTQAHEGVSKIADATKEDREAMDKRFADVARELEGHREALENEIKDNQLLEDFAKLQKELDAIKVESALASEEWTKRHEELATRSVPDYAPVEVVQAIQAEVKGSSDDFLNRMSVLDKAFDDFKKEYENRDNPLQPIVDAHSESLKKLGSEIETGLEARATDIDTAQRALHSVSERVTGLEENIDETLKTSIEPVIETAEKANALAIENAAKVEQVKAELLQEVTKAVEAQSGDLAEDVIKRTADVVAKVSENLVGERGPTGYVSRAQSYVADYQFNTRSVVTHKGGLWQSLRDTVEEPGAGAQDWASVTRGVQSMRVASIPGNPGAFEMIVKDSTDQETALPFDVPVPNLLKTYDPEVAYKYYDSVMADGHRWLAKCDDPQGAPEKSDDWALFSMRGGRGQKGAPGPRGAMGVSPDPKVVADAYKSVEDAEEGVPMRRMRGKWEFGKSYQRGDVLSSGHMLVAVKTDHIASTPPTENDPRYEVASFGGM